MAAFKVWFPTLRTFLWPPAGQHLCLFFPLGPEVACEVGVLFWGLLPGAADGAAGGGA